MRMSTRVRRTLATIAAATLVVTGTRLDRLGGERDHRARLPSPRWRRSATRSR